MKTELANYLNAETEKLKAEQRKQHTPGPWHLRGDTVLVSPSLQICQVDRGNKHPETAKANARLISAAPELLEACELVDRAHAGDGVDMATAVDACLLALAKAKGE